MLYATTLPGDPEWFTYPTYTFVVVYRKGYAPGYFAYGPKGVYSGPLKRVFYEQDIAIYRGKDKEHVFTYNIFFSFPLVLHAMDR